MDLNLLLQYRKCFRVLETHPVSFVRYIEEWFGDTIRNLQMFYVSYINLLLSGVLSNTIRITKSNVWAVYKSLLSIDPRYPTPQDVVATPVLEWMRGLNLEMPEYAKRSYIEAGFSMVAWRDTFPQTNAKQAIGVCLSLGEGKKDNAWLFIGALEHYYLQGNGLGYLLLRLNLTTVDQTTINKLNRMIDAMRNVNWDLVKSMAILTKANNGFLNYGMDTLPEFNAIKIKREKRQRRMVQFKAGFGTIALILGMDCVVRLLGC